MMKRLHRLISVGLGSKAVVVLLVAISYLVALIQHPGRAAADTKVDLYVDPWRFVEGLLSVWNNTAGLGHLQGGQYSGYLFPMGPFFALGELLSLPVWLVQRLWLGTLFAAAVWGVVRLVECLYGRKGGIAPLLAGALYLFNPYVVVFTGRTSVTLLGYALLPWLILITYRGIRSPKSWWYPVAFGLLVASTGGGVNAAVTAFTLIGPLLLMLYEPFTKRVEWKAVAHFGVKTLLATAVTSLWWIAPVLVQAFYGVDFLDFTEQPGAIWGTASVPEALRLMGYWVSYLGVGYSDALTPYFGSSSVLLFNPVVVTVSLLIPVAVIWSFIWSRRWVYGPFFMIMLLIGVFTVTAGFPIGKPLERLLSLTYYQVESVQFLRTTYKAAPLTLLALAVLAGVGAAEGWVRLSRRLESKSLLSREAVGAGLTLLCVASLALFAWPLVRGQAVNSEVLYDSVPQYWQDAAAELDRELPANSRAAILPGSLFPFYQWGGTQDPILPVLSKRPVATRYIVPYSDLRATELLWRTDELVQQQRAVPGQLNQLLDLLSVRSVFVATDGDRARSGEVSQQEAAALLSREPHFSKPARSYGSSRKFFAPVQKSPESVSLPKVRRYDLEQAKGLLRVERSKPTTVVDGSAQALLQLAAFDQLSSKTPIFYAADLYSDRKDETDWLASKLDNSGTVVFSDTNRREIFVNSRLRQNSGRVLDSGQSAPVGAAVLSPFDQRKAEFQTTTKYYGAKYIRSLFAPGFARFPENRPYAAFDGDPTTSWLADGALSSGSQRWIEVEFDAPRDVAYIDVLPHIDSRGRVDRVEINNDKKYDLKPGLTRLRVDLKDVDHLRIRVVSVHRPDDGFSGAGGFAEVKVPGLKIQETLSLPSKTAEAAAQQDLKNTSLIYLFERSRADDPYRLTNAVGSPQAGEVRNRRSPEALIKRSFTAPTTRSYKVRAWLSVSQAASDAELDGLAGYRGSSQFTSSGRFENQPRYRASSAFDGSSSRYWLGSWIKSAGAWLEWSLPNQVTVKRFKLRSAPIGVREPTVVRLRADEATTGPLKVASDGSVELSAPLSGKRFRLEVLKAEYPKGTVRKKLRRRAVGIGEIEIPGIKPVEVPTSGSIESTCSAARLSVDSETVGIRPMGSVQQLDLNRPLKAEGCSRVKITEGPKELETVKSVLSVDYLQLSSQVKARAAVGGGKVAKVDRVGSGSYDGVKLSVNGPSWLVLGESYNRGWRAECSGKDLGKSQPIDGFANGWQIGSSCKLASVTFAPDKYVKTAYLLSLLSALMMSALLVARRSRRLVSVETASELGCVVKDGAVVRKSLKSAVETGFVVGLAASFLFALRTGPFIAVVFTLLLWRGMADRRLIKSGVLLLAAVPVLYYIGFGSEGVLWIDDSQGGYNFQYAATRIWAHWVSLLALLLVGVVVVRELKRLRS